MKPSVYLADEQDVTIDSHELRQLVFNTLTHEQYPPRVEVTIVLVDEPAMTEYNKRFMDRAGPTDVLSFPLEELVPEKIPTIDEKDPPINLGDIVIAPSYVRKQALGRDVGFEDEMALMVVHGMLHLMGWDHEDDAEAEHMEARESDILGTVGRERP